MTHCQIFVAIGTNRVVRPRSPSHDPGYRIMPREPLEIPSLEPVPAVLRRDSRVSIPRPIAETKRPDRCLPADRPERCAPLPRESRAGLPRQSQVIRVQREPASLGVLARIQYIACIQELLPVISRPFHVRAGRVGVRLGEPHPRCHRREKSSPPPGPAPQQVFANQTTQQCEKDAVQQVKRPHRLLADSKSPDAAMRPTLEPPS